MDRHKKHKKMHNTHACFVNSCAFSWLKIAIFVRSIYNTTMPLRYGVTDALPIDIYVQQVSC